MNPLLSIVVPTKDRYEYLIPLINLIHSFNFDEIELIIQDNTTENKYIIEYIKELNYNNLKYFHNGEQLSVARNSDLGILNSRGKYVCLIGDDDGVSLNILSVVKWMDAKGIDVLKTAIISYKWPGFNVSKISDFSGVLMMGFYDKRYKKINAIAELKKCLVAGGNLINLLPKVYHNIAKRTTLNKVYEIGQTFFPGPSPDMANSVAMSFVVENFVFLNFPVVIPGNSVRAGGDAQKFKKQRAQISEVLFLPKDTEEKWECFIPKIWSPETIMPESACKSLKYMGKFDYIEKYLCKEKMLAIFFVAHMDLINLCMKISHNKLLLTYYVSLEFIKKVFRVMYSKLLFFLFDVTYSGNIFGGGIFIKSNYLKIVRNITDINGANKFLMNREKTFNIT